MTVVYCIKNKDDLYFNEGGWSAFPFCSIFIDYDRASYRLQKIMQDIARLSPKKDMVKRQSGYKIVSMNMTPNIVEIFDSSKIIEGAIIREKIRASHPAFHDFWEHLCKIGASDNVEFILKVNGANRYNPGQDELKEIRDNIRLLGVKTNQYRSQRYFFAFNSSEDAMNARLCLDTSDFIDVRSIREEARKMMGYV